MAKRAVKRAAKKAGTVSTLVVGEETIISPTTVPIGEETTFIAGEGQTTLRVGEEHLTTLRVGEEGVIYTTLVVGEEGGLGPVSDLVAENFPWLDPGGPVENPVRTAATARSRKRRG